MLNSTYKKIGCLYGTLFVWGIGCETSDCFWYSRIFEARFSAQFAEDSVSEYRQINDFLLNKYLGKCCFCKSNEYLVDHLYKNCIFIAGPKIKGQKFKALRSNIIKMREGNGFVSS